MKIQYGRNTKISNIINKMVSKLVCVLLVIVMCKGYNSPKNLKLKQVLILSRHNIRYPIEDELNRYSPKPFPPAAGPPGLLTPKGARLERYMAEYFSEWFRKEQFLPEGCPDEDTVYVYANKVSRTKATARAFVNSMFKGCNVTVHYKQSREADPLFNIAIHNTTEAYKNWGIEEITRKLQNNSKLMAGYSELNKILEIEGSDICKQDGMCDLTTGNNRIQCGKSVSINGPLPIASAVVDSFLMSYYDGIPINDIAWGQITTPEKWKLLVEIINQEQNIKDTTVAEDVAAPLVQYLTRIFKNYDEMPKLILLVGHDNNMNTLVNALGFDPIDLPNQFEKFPVGGKFVFQRWTDSKKDYLKVEYVYPSWSQIRNGSKYSLKSPPQRVVMRLNWCNTDEYGFCPWNEFVNKL